MSWQETDGLWRDVVIHDNGWVHIEGIELYLMGQTNIISKYLLNFQSLDKYSKCFVWDYSIQYLYYHCILIHGMHELEVSDDVAFNVVGHYFAIEDGFEQNNQIKYNLAVHINFIGRPAGGEESRFPATIPESKDLEVPVYATESGL